MGVGACIVSIPTWFTQCTPDHVVLPNRFTKETVASYPGAHIGAPLRIFHKFCASFPWRRRGEPTCSPSRIILSYRLWRGKRCCPICGRPMVAPTIRLQFFIGAAKTVRASIDAYFQKQKVDFIINDRANLFYYPLRNRIMQAITPCVPLLPKDNFLFENIGDNIIFSQYNI